MRRARFARAEGVGLPEGEARAAKRSQEAARNCRGVIQGEREPQTPPRHETQLRASLSSAVASAPTLRVANRVTNTALSSALLGWASDSAALITLFTTLRSLSFATYRRSLNTPLSIACQNKGSGLQTNLPTATRLRYPPSVSELCEAKWLSGVRFGSPLRRAAVDKFIHNPHSPS